MKYLIVVAHPDDEVLGAGASMYKWSLMGDKIDVCIMSAEAKARAFRPEDGELENDTNTSIKFMGVERKFEGDFPNIEMNTVPHLKLVQFIESAIKEGEPDIVITHHPADTNNDHLQTSMACQEAIRLFQRRPEVKRIQEFWYMEVPSCTEWKINNAFNAFNPNCYVEVGKVGVEAKIRALSMYRGVMRPYPHPRSAEYITGLAAMRGGQWGLDYAEAFEVVLREYNLKKDRILSPEEVKDKVARFIDIEEHSSSPVLLTPENVSKLCYITIDEAADALKALGR